MPLHEAKLERIEKAEWLEAYNKARENCFTSRNISSAWRGAGLVPFDRKKLERNLRIEKTAEPSIAPAARQTPNKEYTINYLLPLYPQSLENFSKHVMTCVIILVWLYIPVRSFIVEQSTRRILHEHGGSHVSFSDLNLKAFGWFKNLI